MRLSLDTNVFFYALDLRDDRRRMIAIDLIDRLFATDVIVAAQVFGELLNAVRTKRSVADFEEARSALDDWSLQFVTEATKVEDMIEGANLAVRHKLQLWDSVILSVCARAGVNMLFSEDMSDGAIYHGAQVMNPFNLANRETLDALLKPVS